MFSFEMLLYAFVILALDDKRRALGWEMLRIFFSIQLSEGRACAAVTFSVPDWLRKHLGLRNSGIRFRET